MASITMTVQMQIETATAPTRANDFSFFGVSDKYAPITRQHGNVRLTELRATVSPKDSEQCCNTSAAVLAVVLSSVDQLCATNCDSFSKTSAK